MEHKHWFKRLFSNWISSASGGDHDVGALVERVRHIGVARVVENL